MNNPSIHILIRNMFRPELLRRCLKSIAAQNYHYVNIIACSDSEEAYQDFESAYKESGIKGWGYINTLVKPTKEDHFWNLYCNELKRQVYDGWFFFMDNDDYLKPGSLQKLSTYLTEDIDGIICQFVRNGWRKPADVLLRSRLIIKGMIGGGCLVLSHKHKLIADWDGEKAADYRWIKEVSKQVKLKFIPLILQVAGNNGLHGQ